MDVPFQRVAGNAIYTPSELAERDRREDRMSSEIPGRAAPYDPEVSDVSLSEAIMGGFGVVILTIDNCSTMLTRGHLSGMYSWIGEWLARHPMERPK